MKKTASLLSVLLLILLCPVLCHAESAPVWLEMEKTGSLELLYATEFSVDEYGAYSLISVTDGRRYLVVPEGVPVPEQLEADITVLQQPIDRVYMVATSAMDLYRAIGGIDRIRFSCLKQSGWYVEEAVQAMEEGRMIFAGKYSAPDYETLLAEKCGLAVESTMVYHTPEVVETLESLGIPVFIERSSRETHPLGRMEWMKVHALMLGCLADAQELFRQEAERLAPVLEQESTGKTVAFFTVNEDGSVTVRKSQDYLVKTIALAGGEYIYEDMDGSSSQTTATITMESFYAETRDADILICGSTMATELQTRQELLAQCRLLADFPAFQRGDVWSTRYSLFQSTMGLGEFILEVNSVLTGQAEENMQFLYRLP